ncbi:O-antigen ligase [Pricia antarctica]|uniref:O-antigen ligase n=2 Tax=Pricia antarctica TaxID=641691 RepID=A0A1G6YPY8_9FLAO|nr:O-antigen ligase [Pricia antarctica]
MDDYSKLFNFELDIVQFQHFYIYFVITAIIAFYLTVKSASKYKFVLFFISFFLLTGNLNDLLTIKIPGFSLFEIQPDRFLFVLLSFFIVGKTLFSRYRPQFRFERRVPWFEVALFSYVIMLTASQLFNISEIGVGYALKTILDALGFMVIMIGISLMADRPSYDLIGKSIIIGAIGSSMVSLVQLSVDPYFLRIGDNRLAVGTLLRANGIFSAEYFNSYYLIIAIVWTLIIVKSNQWKISLITLYSLGVLSSFQRMSWLILILILLTYTVYIKKVDIGKLLLAGLSFVVILLSVSLFYYQDIMNSSLVKERLSEPINSREGYYTMVLDNIGKKPVFGYGNLENEVYYVNLLRITGDRDRATATTGDLHSGYFGALFLYGIPAAVFFTLFVVLSVLYYSKSVKEDMYFILPFLVSILYMIGNLTNTFLFLKYISLLFAIHIGIGKGINRIKEQAF